MLPRYKRNISAAWFYVDIALRKNIYKNSSTFKIVKQIVNYCPTGNIQFTQEKNIFICIFFEQQQKYFFIIY